MRVLLLLVGLVMAGCSTVPEVTSWRFDGLDRIGGVPVRVDGTLALIATGAGPAVGYRQAPMAPDKRHPLRRWCCVAMSYDGTMFRSYVDGVLLSEAAIAFAP